MTLTLPPGLPKPVIDCVAGHFPRGDETAARRTADYWSDKAEQCRGYADHHDTLAVNTDNDARGHFGTALTQAHRELATKFRSQADYNDTLAEQLYEGANSIELQKWTVIGFATILAWQLARAALMFSPAGAAIEAYIDRQATQTACQIAKRKLLIFLTGQASKYATQRGVLVLAGKAMFWGTLQVGGINAAVQAGQIAADHRTSMDWKSVGIAAAAGGVGGAAGAAAGMWIGGRWIIPNTIAHAEKATSTAARVAFQLTGTSLTGTAGGLVGGIMGALASLALSGEPLTTKAITETLIPAITGGFLGAAAHGATEIRSATPISAASTPESVAPPTRSLRDLADALAAHGIVTRDFDPNNPSPVHRQQQIDELLTRLRQPSTKVDKPAPEPYHPEKHNRVDHQLAGLRNALPDNANSPKAVKFPARAVSTTDPAGRVHTATAPESTPPQPTPLRSALAEHLDFATAKHPADSESSVARPHPADPAESPAAAPRPEAARPGRGHSGGDNNGASRARMPDSDQGTAEPPPSSETGPTTTYPADNTSGAPRTHPAAERPGHQRDNSAATDANAPRPGHSQTTDGTPAREHPAPTDKSAPPKDADTAQPSHEPEPRHVPATDDADGSPTTTEAEPARTHDDSATAVEPDPAELAARYHAEADAILDEHAATNWSTVSAEGLEWMLRHGDERQAALAVVEVICREEGKTLRWTQVMAMLAMRDGVVNMDAGEGKTLVFLAVAAVDSASGGPAQVITTRDTLANHAFDQYQNILGKYGFDIVRMDPDNPYPQPADGKATIYIGTMNDAGFGELRGNVVPGRYKSVDEIDEALVHANTTFILSEGSGSPAGPEVVAQVADAGNFLADALHAKLLTEADFGRYQGQIGGGTALTEAGRAKIEQVLGRELTDAEAHRLTMAATAKWEYVENDHYVVWHHPELGPEFRTDSDGSVVTTADREPIRNPESHKIYIIDQTSHKVMFDAETSTESRWNGGLAQAIEAEHGIQIRDDPAGSTSITARELFSQENCDKLNGASGTAKGVAEELRQNHGVDQVVEIPRFKESQLTVADDHVAPDQATKLRAMAESIAERQSSGRPQLAICNRNSEVAELSALLHSRGVEHVAVDAKWFLARGVHAETELQQIFDEAGKQGKVLVINRQGGRGVDIPVAADVDALGGLHVLISSRSAESRDVDVQAENRTARSGGNGSAQYFSSPDDALYAGSLEARITVIRYTGAVARHETAVAEYQLAFAEHQAAPTAETKAELAAATNNLQTAQHRLAAAESDIRGMVSKLQTSGIRRPTTSDPATAHLPNGPPAADTPRTSHTPGQAQRPPQPIPALPFTTRAFDPVAARQQQLDELGTILHNQQPPTTATNQSTVSTSIDTASEPRSGAPAANRSATATTNATAPETPSGRSAAHTRQSAADPGQADTGTATTPVPTQATNARAAMPARPIIATNSVSPQRASDTFQDESWVASPPGIRRDPAMVTAVDPDNPIGPNARLPHQPPVSHNQPDTNGHNATPASTDPRTAPEELDARGPESTSPVSGKTTTAEATRANDTVSTDSTDRPQQSPMSDPMGEWPTDDMVALLSLARQGSRSAAKTLNRRLAPGTTQRVSALLGWDPSRGTAPEPVQRLASAIGVTALRAAERDRWAVPPGLDIGDWLFETARKTWHDNLAQLTTAQRELLTDAADATRHLIDLTERQAAEIDRLTRQVHANSRGRLLPTAQELARQLRLSSGTSKGKDYRQLADEGYVVTRHGVGTLVADPQPETPPTPNGSSALSKAAAGVATATRVPSAPSLPESPISHPDAEAEKYIKQAIAADLFLSYGIEVLGLDQPTISIDTAMSIRNAIVDELAENGPVRIDAIVVAPLENGTYAAAGKILDGPEHIVFLNSTYFGHPENFRDEFEREVAAARLNGPTGDPAYDLIRHEVAHLRDPHHLTESPGTPYAELAAERAAGTLHPDARFDRRRDYTGWLEAKAFGFLYTHFVGLKQARALPVETRFDEWLDLLNNYSRELKQLDAGSRRRIFSDAENPGVAEPALGDRPVFNPREALPEANNAFGKSAPDDFTHPVYALQALLRGVPVAQVWRDAKQRNDRAAARAEDRGPVPAASGFQASMRPDGVLVELSRRWGVLLPDQQHAQKIETPVLMAVGRDGRRSFGLDELVHLVNRQLAEGWGANSRSHVSDSGDPLPGFSEWDCAPAGELAQRLRVVSEMSWERAELLRDLRQALAAADSPAEMLGLGAWADAGAAQAYLDIADLRTRVQQALSRQDVGDRARSRLRALSGHIDAIARQCGNLDTALASARARAEQLAVGHVAAARGGLALGPFGQIVDGNRVEVFERRDQPSAATEVLRNMLRRLGIPVILRQVRVDPTGRVLVEDLPEPVRRSITHRQDRLWQLGTPTNDARAADEQVPTALESSWQLGATTELPQALPAWGARITDAQRKLARTAAVRQRLFPTPVDPDRMTAADATRQRTLLARLEMLTEYLRTSRIQAAAAAAQQCSDLLPGRRFGRWARLDGNVLTVVSPFTDPEQFLPQPMREALAQAGIRIAYRQVRVDTQGRAWSTELSPADSMQLSAATDDQSVRSLIDSTVEYLDEHLGRYGVTRASGAPISLPELLDDRDNLVAERERARIARDRWRTERDRMSTVRAATESAAHEAAAENAAHFEREFDRLDTEVARLTLLAFDGGAAPMQRESARRILRSDARTQGLVGTAHTPDLLQAVSDQLVSHLQAVSRQLEADLDQPVPDEVFDRDMALAAMLESINDHRNGLSHDSPDNTDPADTSPQPGTGVHLAYARAATHPGSRPLSKRQRTIYALITEGKTNAEIADSLQMPVETVKTHVRRIRDKLGVPSRSELEPPSASTDAVEASPTGLDPEFLLLRRRILLTYLIGNRIVSPAIIRRIGQAADAELRRILAKQERTMAVETALMLANMNKATLRQLRSGFNHAQRTLINQSSKAVQNGREISYLQLVMVNRLATEVRKISMMNGVVGALELSGIELAILRLIAASKTNSEIAHALPQTDNVVTHRRSLFRKRDVHDRTEAVVQALRLRVLALHEIPEPDSAAASQLDDRDHQILLLLTTAASYQDIAQAIAISTSNVAARIRRMLRILGARNQTEAVVRALRLGILDLDNIPLPDVIPTRELSDREVKALRLVATGEVAGAISGIVRALGTNDRTAAVIQALRLGYLQLDDLPLTDESHRLSPSEIEILRLVAAGNSNSRIAAALQQATETVKAALLRLFWKLGVRDRTEAVITALRLGYLDLDRIPTHHMRAAASTVASGTATQPDDDEQPSPEEQRFLEWYRARVADDSRLPRQGLADYLEMHKLEMAQVYRWLTRAGIDPDIDTVEQVGQFPAPETDEIAAWLSSVRRYLGVTAGRMDELIGVPQGTWIAAEQGRIELDIPAVRALLRRVPGARRTYDRAALLFPALCTPNGEPAYPEGYEHIGEYLLFRRNTSNTGQPIPGLTQSDVSALIKKAVYTIRRWETGAALPPAAAVADLLDAIPTDYAVTFDEVAENFDYLPRQNLVYPSFSAVKSFREYLRYLRRSNNLTRAEAARRFGYSKHTIRAREEEYPEGDIEAFIVGAHRRFLHSAGQWNDLATAWGYPRIITDSAGESIPDPTDCESINHWLHTLRIYRGITLQQFAELTDRSVTAIVNIENGESRPGILFLRKLRDSVGMPTSVLRDVLLCFPTHPDSPAADSIQELLFWKLIDASPGSIEESQIQDQIFREFTEVADELASGWNVTTQERAALAEIGRDAIRTAILNFVPPGDFAPVAGSAARYAMLRSTYYAQPSTSATVPGADQPPATPWQKSVSTEGPELTDNPGPDQALDIVGGRPGEFSEPPRGDRSDTLDVLHAYGKDRRSHAHRPPGGDRHVRSTNDGGTPWSALKRNADKRFRHARATPATNPAIETDAIETEPVPPDRVQALVDRLGLSPVQLRQLAAGAIALLRNYLGPDATLLSLTTPVDPDDVVQASAARAHAVARWWNSLTLPQQAALILLHPHQIGNADGVPYSVRDEANRRSIIDDIKGFLKRRDDADQTGLLAEARTLLGLGRPGLALSPEQKVHLTNLVRTLQHLAALEQDVREFGSPPVQLIAFDATAYDGDGRIIVSIDDADEAAIVTRHLGGVGNTLLKLPKRAQAGIAQYVESARHNPGVPTATIIDIGFHHPNTIEEIRSSELAEQGGHVVAADIAAYDATRAAWANLPGGAARPRLRTVVAHSYGSTTLCYAGIGGRLAAHLDQVVLTGSPGAGPMAHADEFGIGADNVFAVADDRDPVTKAGGATPEPTDRYFGFTHGSSPVGPWGAIRLAAAMPSTVRSVKRIHGGYLAYLEPGQPTVSLRNIALVCAGKADSAERAQHRPAADATGRLRDLRWWQANETALAVVMGDDEPEGAAEPNRLTDNGSQLVLGPAAPPATSSPWRRRGAGEPVRAPARAGAVPDVAAAFDLPKGKRPDLTGIDRDPLEALRERHRTGVVFAADPNLGDDAHAFEPTGRKPNPPAEEPVSLRQLLSTNKPYRRLYISNALTGVGDNVQRSALPLLTLDLTGSPMAAGVTSFALFLPQVLFELPAGYIADFHDRRRTMLLAQAVGLTSTAAAGAMVLVGASDLGTALATATLVEGTAAVFYRRSLRSAVLDLVTSAQRPRANRLSEIEVGIATTGGRALGPILLDAAKSLPFITNGATYGWNLATLFRMRDSLPLHAAADSHSFGDSLRRMGEGMRTVWQEPFLREYSGLTMLTNASFAALNLRTAAVLDAASAPGLAAGAVLAAAGVGSVVGGLLPNRFIEKVRADVVYPAQLAGFAGVATLQAVSTDPIAIAAGAFGVAALGVSMNARVAAYEQAVLPPSLYGRATSAKSMVLGAGPAMGGLLGGAVLSSQGITPAGWIPVAIIGAAAAGAATRRLVNRGRGLLGFRWRRNEATPAGTAEAIPEPVSAAQRALPGHADSFTQGRAGTDRDFAAAAHAYLADLITVTRHHLTHADDRATGLDLLSRITDVLSVVDTRLALGQAPGTAHHELRQLHSELTALLDDAAQDRGDEITDLASTRLAPATPGTTALDRTLTRLHRVGHPFGDCITRVSRAAWALGVDNGVQPVPGENDWEALEEAVTAQLTPVYPPTTPTGGDPLASIVEAVRNRHNGTDSAVVLVDDGTEMHSYLVTEVDGEVVVFDTNVEDPDSDEPSTPRIRTQDKWTQSFTHIEEAFVAYLKSGDNKLTARDEPIPDAARSFPRRGPITGPPAAASAAANDMPPTPEVPESPRTFTAEELETIADLKRQLLEIDPKAFEYIRDLPLPEPGEPSGDEWVSNRGAWFDALFSDEVEKLREVELTEKDYLELGRILERFPVYVTLTLLVATGLKVEQLLHLPRTSPGSLFFKQVKRVQGDKTTIVYKFRTMPEDEQEKPSNRDTADRISRGQQFVRDTSLDELPQLLAIARGRMQYYSGRPMLDGDRERMRRVLTPDEFAFWDAHPKDDLWSALHFPGCRALDPDSDEYLRSRYLAARLWSMIGSRRAEEYMMQVVDRYLLGILPGKLRELVWGTGTDVLAGVGHILGRIGSWTQRVALSVFPDPDASAAAVADGPADDRAPVPARGAMPPGADTIAAALGISPQRAREIWVDQAITPVHGGANPMVLTGFGPGDAGRRY
ncbi:MFS transporter [Nocardia pseudovaccinii]|uniref:MFS transporter n=1 Tax=Nocardia pseudovaccinii TaxID=189540 RepID=UPI003D8B00E1